MPDDQHFIASLQQDIKDWEEAAALYEKRIHSVLFATPFVVGFWLFIGKWLDARPQQGA